MNIERQRRYRRLSAKPYIKLSESLRKLARYGQINNEKHVSIYRIAWPTLTKYIGKRLQYRIAPGNLCFDMQDRATAEITGVEELNLL